jgi:hypothetical protein
MLRDWRANTSPSTRLAWLASTEGHSSADLTAVLVPQACGHPLHPVQAPKARLPSAAGVQPRHVKADDGLAHLVGWRQTAKRGTAYMHGQVQQMYARPLLSVVLDFVCWDFVATLASVA